MTPAEAARNAADNWQAQAPIRRAEMLEAEYQAARETITRHASAGNFAATIPVQPETLVRLQADGFTTDSLCHIHW